MQDTRSYRAESRCLQTNKGSLFFYHVAALGSCSKIAWETLYMHLAVLGHILKIMEVYIWHASVRVVFIAKN